MSTPRRRVIDSTDPDWDDADSDEKVD